MNFYLISSESNSQTNDTFINACKNNKNVDLVYVDIKKYPEKNFKKPLC